MNTKTTRFDQAYLAKKRLQLTALRDEILGTRGSQAAEEAGVNAESSGGAREYEDDAQKLTTLELEGSLIALGDARLADVERALRKIEEGTYGVSDASGKPIPVERLDAVPEAIRTIEEQETAGHAQ